MRTRPHLLFLSLIILIGVTTSFAQSFSPFEASVESVADQEIQFLDVQRGVVLPKGDKTFELVLPTPDGNGLTVDLLETTAFAPSMKAKYPEIKTYRGYSNETGALVAVLQDPRGISVYIKEIAAPSWQIEPIGLGRARMGTTLAISGDEDITPLACGYVPGDDEVAPTSQHENNLQSRQAQVVKRKYILALACTGEFGARNGGTKASVNAVYAQAMNVMNGIIIEEVAAEFELHPDNDTLIFLNPSTDPYRVPNLGSALLGENPPIINTRINVNSYDLGHVFTNRCDDVGGVVSGRACDNAGKARGVTCDASGNIVRTVENIMVHEVAHQFAVSHSWNNCPGNDGQRAGQAAFEPGSGSTIMSYQGACGTANNMSFISSPQYYHIGSIQQFINFSRGGFGETCADLSPVNNNEPEIVWPYTNGFAIPLSTPFMLEANATDPDGDALLFNWEQYDLGNANNLCDQNANSPLFRSLPPSPTGNQRYFPAQNTVRRGLNDCEEQLPLFDRELNFRLTARDRNPLGGGTVWQQLTFNVDGNAGPFRVTSQTSLAETYAAGSFINVTWDVANTNVAPVNCQAVNILLSMDDGITFPYILSENTVNDGAEGVTLPVVEGDRARIKVEAADNIFYQLSPSRFNIVTPTAPGFTFVPSNTTNFICLPQLGEVEFFTAPLLGYDSTLTLRIANTLPSGVVANLSETQIVPGSSSMLSVDFSAFNQTDSVRIVIEASGPSVDTALREILFDVVSNDFSDLSLIGPFDGQSGLSGLPVFSYTPSSRATRHILQVSDDPLFGLGTTEIIDPDPAGSDLGQLLALNSVYFWRILPSNRCGDDFDVATNAFHTFAANCQSYTNDEPLIIPANLRETVNATISIAESGQVNDLNVPIVDVQFANMQDIRVVLEAPDGTEARLYSRRCQGDRLLTGFDDESPITFSCNPPPIDGGLRKPQNPLSIFNGKEIQGDWNLRVEALEPSTSGGQFRNFEIEFCANIVSQAPTLDLNLVEVPLGGFQILERSVLSANDPDNGSTDLEFIVVTLPTRGHLELYGSVLSIGDRWNMSQSQTGALVYVDDNGVTPGTDSMSIVLTDNSGNLIATPTINFDIAEGFVVSNQNIEASSVEMLLAPNPTQAFTTVRWGAPSQGGQLNIIDGQGRLVAQQQVADGQRDAQIDMSTMPKGVYHINYRGEEGTRTLRLIVQ